MTARLDEQLRTAAPLERPTTERVHIDLAALISQHRSSQAVLPFVITEILLTIYMCL